MKYYQPLIPGSVFHIFNQAVGEEWLFRESDNYRYFLYLASKHLPDVAHMYAYVLLPNHFHFLLQIKDVSKLSALYIKTKNSPPPEETDWSKFVMQRFSNFFNAYAKAYNKKYDRKGALFVDYVKRSQILEEDHFFQCLHYVHFNAVHHGLCKKIEDWPWSSYHSYMSPLKSALSKATILKKFDSKEQFISFHNKRPQISGNGLEFL
jgi:REP element-mobilizing transposase RayT